MSGQMPTSDGYWELLNSACDDGLPDTQIQQLATLLDSDTTARKEFIRHVQLRTDVQLLCRAEKACDGGLARVQAILPEASSSVSPVITLLDTTIPGTVGFFSSDWSLSYLIATVVCGIAALVGSLIYVSRSEQVAENSPARAVERQLDALPKVESVGRITGMVDCQWVQSPESRVQSLALNSRLSSLVSLGDTFSLRSGLLEITYNTGAKVILQGPVTYEVESSAGGYLAVGKLTARVEKGGVGRGTGGSGSQSLIPNPQSLAASPQSPIPNPSLATSHYPLFTIKTPTATVTDLGTEFGVEVDKQGCTTSHVFRGLVRVQLVGAGKQSEAAGQLLRENETVRVDSGQGQRKIIVVAAASAANFIRDLPKLKIKTFDLVDALAGGDGFSGLRNKGIDPITGRVVDALATAAEAPSPWPGDGQYHRVTGRPFVDGVFVPNGGKGAVQVDSAGHVCDKFLQTANTSWQYIWAGGSLLTDKVRTTIDEVDYASPGHGLLYFNGNGAVTFDLEAIRRANPGCKLLRFRATAADNSRDDTGGCADIWVLVDGEKRFQRRQINRNSGSFAVLVPIHDTDRFLTLAATDGGDDIYQDWIIFGDPTLELVLVGTAGNLASQ